jgi:hypothetical protein
MFGPPKRPSVHIRRTPRVFATRCALKRPPKRPKRPGRRRGFYGLALKRDLVSPAMQAAIDAIEKTPIDHREFAA